MPDHDFIFFNKIFECYNDPNTLSLLINTQQTNIRDFNSCVHIQMGGLRQVCISANKPRLPVAFGQEINEISVFFYNKIKRMSLRRT